MDELFHSLDRQVSHCLGQWPQRPPGVRPRMQERDAWLRARPCADRWTAGTGPFLKLAGSDRLRTLPDGLWLNFGGTAREPFVDIFGIM